MSTDKLRKINNRLNAKRNFLMLSTTSFYFIYCLIVFICYSRRLIDF